MGTRGVMGFYKDGKHKVAYNHFDSYPNGLGAEILEICQNATIEKLNEMFNKIAIINEEIKPTNKQIAKCFENNSVDLGVSKQSVNDWYCLLRNAQGDLMKYAEIGFMPDSATFLHDSLFCEYAYIINLDTNKLEIYTGFNKEKPIGRYAEIKPNDSGYYAINLKLEIPLDECNKWTPEGIEKEIEEEPEKEPE